MVERQITPKPKEHGRQPCTSKCFPNFYFSRLVALSEARNYTRYSKDVNFLLKILRSKLMKISDPQGKTFRHDALAAGFKPSVTSVLRKRVI
jgi:hypothetical protein